MYKYHFITMVRNTFDVPQMSIGDRINSFCEKYNMSHAEFARLANEYAKKYNVKVTDRDIHNYTAHRCCPKIDKLTAISKAMGVPVAYFVGYGNNECKSSKQKIEKRALLTLKEAKPPKFRVAS